MNGEARRRKGACTTRGEFLSRMFIAESVPVFLALPFSFFFFVQTVPFAQERWREYVFAMLAIFAVTRIPNFLLVTKVVAVPCFEWMELRQNTRRVPQSELARLYLRLTGVVPRLELQAAVLWAVAAVSLILVSRFWLDQGPFALFTLGYTGLLTAALSLCFSYFTFQLLVRPFVEEVATLLPEPPTQGVLRIPMAAKVGVSIFTITTLAFVAFGLLMWVRSQAVFEEYSLQVNSEAARNLVGRLDKPESLAETDALLKAYSNPTRIFALVGLDGEALSSVNSSGGSRELAAAARSVAREGKPESLRVLSSGPMMFFRTRGGQALLVLQPNPAAIATGVRSLLTVTAGFLLCVLLILGAYIFWLTRDIARLMRLTERYSQRLALGNLTESPAVWSDDELGVLMENLRATFRGLTRLAREMHSAAGSVETEAGRLAVTSREMASAAAEQTAQAGRTEKSAIESGRGAAEAASAMGLIATATQDVSATILQMQASVDEMAGTAEVLGRSTESSVSSTNEIATTAEQVREATAQLQQSGQEAVSFLTELDASLGETREGSAALSGLASQVTNQAEAGFTRVAAVEEEILRTQRAGEESHRALSELQTSLESIGRILDVIQDITEQTNLLSLNASIIAAGAGEHGRAFGVVASQIRELSSKTRVRAAEIRRVIHTLQAGGAEISSSMNRVFATVERSATLSREAGASLRTILESASSQEEMTKRIAAATEELAHGGQAASRTMHQIFDRIEGIVRSVEEQARSTRLLSIESERVREVVLQLRHATEEQSRGGQMIARSVADISREAQQTASIVQTQADLAGATASAMQEVSGRARGTERSLETLVQASARLRESAAALDREVGRFRLPEA